MVRDSLGRDGWRSGIEDDVPDPGDPAAAAGSPLFLDILQPAGAREVLSLSVAPIGDDPHGAAPGGPPDILVETPLAGPDPAAAKGGGGKGGGGGGGTGYIPAAIDSGPDGADYNIRVEFKGSGWDATLYQAYVDAVKVIESLIAGDVPDVAVRSRGTLIRVDDILITAELKAIDGAGGILGQAGPTALRSGSDLPATATMQFDSADAAALAGAGKFDEVVLHEMLHSIGFGSIWSYKGLVAGAGTATPYFTGANATAEYRALIHDGTATIRVEEGGGSGTALAHWDEATFGAELMTGYIGSGPSNPLTTITVMSLADLGYQLDPVREHWLGVSNAEIFLA